MEYRIKQILHSGAKGIRGTDRADGRYPMRVGRTIDLKLDDIMLGCPMPIAYLKDKDGSDYNHCLCTSSVKGPIKIEGTTVTIETANSIFIFEKV